MATKKPTARPSVPAFERPLVTVDVVIFTVIDEQLKVLAATSTGLNVAVELLAGTGKT